MRHGGRLIHSGLRGPRIVTLFTVGEDTNHHVGERGCPMCREPYPASCQCGGLMHAAGAQEDADGNIVLITRCDRCGRSEEQLEEP